MSATERVGIEIDLMGYEEALRSMQNLEREMKSLSGFKVRIDAQNRLKELERNAKALRAELERIKSIKPDDFIGPMEKGNTAAKTLAEQMKAVRNEMSQTNAEAQRLRSVLRSVKPLRQVFNGISTSVAHMGSAMQSLGNAISRLMTPLRMMGTGALLGAGYKAMNMVSEGLSSGFSRYDTMKKFPRIMKAMGYSSKQAEKSVNKLDQAVQGLPTSLDDIVQMAQRYTMTLGDLDKGTDLAIAANNAFLASMSTDAQKYQGMMQLQDLMTGKKLRNTEWTSLITSMGAGINEIGKELGYADDEMDTFRKDLLANKVSGEKFLDTLIKVGTGTGKLAKLANQSKDTWEAFTSRIGTAFSRMAYGILTSMDKIVKIATGGEFKSLNSFLDEMIIPGINNLAKSVQNWIKAHPDDIINFFNDLKSIDWRGLGTGIVQGVGELVKGIQSIAKWLGGRNLENVGKWIVRLNMIGQGLLIFGGAIKGLRGVFATLGTAGVGIGRILGGLGFAGASSKLLGFIDFFKNFGKVGEAASTASKVAGAGGAATLGATFKAFIPAIEALAGVGAILTMATGIAALDTKLLSMAVNNMVKITDGMHKVFENVKGLKADSFDGSALKNAVEQMFQMWEVFSGTGETVDAHGVKRGGGRSIAQMDKKLLSDMADSMKSMSSIVGSMSQMKVNMKALKNFKGFDEQTTQGISNFATALGSIYSAFDSSFGGEGASNKGAIDPTKAEGVSSIVESAKTMFGSLNQIMKLIPKLMESTYGAGTQVGRGSPIERLRNMLIGEDSAGGLFKDLQDIFQKMDDRFGDFDTGTMSEKMGQVLESFRSIRKLGNQLSKMGSAGTFDKGAFSGVLSGIESFMSQLDTALDVTVIDSIKTKADSLLVGINSIFTTLNDAVSDVDVTVQIDGDVKGDDELVRQINAADKAIRDAVDGIQTEYSRTVKVTINRSVSTGGDSIPNAASPWHTGGLIKPLYRSKGGDTIFRPKGTDTVPAMLTPGEYVMKKSAVDSFGVRFMQRINNLDIRGAMRELSTKAGHIASVNRGVTYNYTTNNNQQVTQNINTNNPNFAYKRSNRYVMAL